MTNLLAKAARGFSGAVVDIADNALAELRQRRAQEFQYNLGAADRAQVRADEKERADRSFELQKTSSEHQMANSDKSLAIQEENMRADNKSRNAQLGIAQEGLNLQKDNSEFGRVEQAYSGAMAGVTDLTHRIAEIEKMQPKLSSDGTPLEDPKTFQDRKMQMLADLEDRLEGERARARDKVEQIHTQFPQYKKYFVQQKPEPVELPANNLPPPLLRRPVQ